MATTTLGGTASDATLVARHREGDPDALADIYDRHAPAIHAFAARQLRSDHDAADATHDTFLLAHHRLAQLRDPNRLRPWLFAIARNEIVKRGRAHGRAIPTDQTDDLVIDLRDETAELHRDELGNLLRSAAAGLDDRDRELLELSLHGLEGEELADAMGVGVDHSYVLVKRIRDRIERSLGALMVARRGRKDCDELQTLLRDWDGRFSVKIRKRVARHIDDCDVCAKTKLALVSPAALLAAVPTLLPPPPSIRVRLLDSVGSGAVPHAIHAADFSRPHGFPKPATPVGRTATIPPRLLAWMGLGTVIALLAGFSVWQARADEPTEVQVLGASVDAEDEGTGVSTSGAGEDEATAEGAGGGAEPPAPAPGDEGSGGSGGGDGPAGDAGDIPSNPVASPPATSAGEPDDGPEAAPGTTTTDPTTPTTGGADPTVTIGPTVTVDPTVTTDPPARTVPGRFQVDTPRVELGLSSSGVVRLSNTGGTGVQWRGQGDPPLVVPSEGSIEGGQRVNAPVQVTNSGQLSEGPSKGIVSFESAGVSTHVEVGYTVARPPSVTGLSATPKDPRADSIGCDGGDTVGVTARVLDESALGSVVVNWSSTTSSGQTTMTGQGAAWATTMGPFPAGTVTWSVTATDRWGASATTKGTPFEARRCFTIVLPPPTIVIPPPTFIIRP